MATIEEMRAALKAQGPSVDEMRAALKNAGNSQPQQPQGYDYSNIPQVASDLGKSFMNALPVAGQAAGAVVSGGNPVAAGFGQTAGQSVKDALEGAGNAIMHPQEFINSLSQLPTKEDVVNQVNKYMSQFNQGASVEMGGQIIGKAAEAGAQGVKNLAQGTQNAAEQMAKTATGATGLQASKFQPQAGKELLARGVVSFGDTPAKIAAKAGAQVESANQGIDTALKALDQQGVKVKVDDVVANIQKQAESLSKDPSQSQVVKKLNSIVDDIINTGESNVSPLEAEQTKRGFNKIAKNWLDPEQGQAGKIAYRAYRDAVENTATAADQKLGELFKDSKKTYGLMAPIEEAASRRASTLNQSPIGGLLDVAAAGGAGAAVGGPAGLVTGIAAAAARRAIAPRIPSSTAVTLKMVADQLNKVPEYAQIASSNPQAFSALTNQVYDQFKNPEKAPQDPAPQNVLGKGPQKWQQDGAQKLIDSGIPQEQIDKLKIDKKGQDLLVQAASGDKSLKAVVEQLKRENPPKQYPITLRKNGHIATISNDRDYAEAKAEGWL